MDKYTIELFLTGNVKNNVAKDWTLRSFKPLNIDLLNYVKSPVEQNKKTHKRRN